MSDGTETNPSPHEEWMNDWGLQYVTDEEALDDLFDAVLLKRVKMTTKRGSSSDHPDEVVVVEGVVVGRGKDLLVSEDGERFTGRMSLVLDNGHAHHMKPGVTVETWNVGQGGDQTGYWQVAVSFPSRS